MAGIPIGIPALVYSSRVNGKVLEGDVEGALRASRNARRWCQASVAFVVALVAFALLITYTAAN
jgi:hypothetical protein